MPNFTSYEDILRHVLAHGVRQENRTGIDAFSVFGGMYEHDLSTGFPAVTTKKVFLRGVVEELAWMLRGETNVRSLQALGITIWDEWADENGELGPVYGAMWRRFPSHGGAAIDQIAQLVEDLRINPRSRRHIVTAWHPGVVPEQKLPPCHWSFQCSVRPGADGSVDTLDLMWHQRSVDTFLGLPFNIASYALLTHVLARITGLRPGRLIASFGDLHLYANHVHQAEEQLQRAPREHCQLTVSDEVVMPWDLSWSKVSFSHYHPHPPIKAPVAV